MKYISLYLLSFFISSMLMASSFKVKKETAKVYSDAYKSSVITEAKKDDIFSSSERVGMFWKVTTKKGDGFISVLDLQRENEKSSEIQEALFKAAKNHSATEENIRTRSAVMGVRGLNESDDLISATGIRPDIKAVYRMEERIKDDKRINDLEELIAKESENFKSSKLKK